MITTAGTFWMYSILCILGVFFVIFFVPETKGRDLDSIAKLFLKKRGAKLVNESKEISGDLDKIKQKSKENVIVP